LIDTGNLISPGQFDPESMHEYNEKKRQSNLLISST